MRQELRCFFGFHNMILKKVSVEYSKDTCECGAWKTFHKPGPTGLKQAGDCGNFREMKAYKAECVYCGEEDKDASLRAEYDRQARIIGV